MALLSPRGRLWRFGQIWPKRLPGPMVLTHPALIWEKNTIWQMVSKTLPFWAASHTEAGAGENARCKPNNRRGVALFSTWDKKELPEHVPDKFQKSPKVVLRNH